MFIIDHFEVRDDLGKAVGIDEEAVGLHVLSRPMPLILVDFELSR